MTVVQVVMATADSSKVALNSMDTSLAVNAQVYLNCVGRNGCNVMDTRASAMRLVRVGGWINEARHGNSSPWTRISLVTHLVKHTQAQWCISVSVLMCPYEYEC